MFLVNLAAVLHTGLTGCWPRHAALGTVLVHLVITGLPGQCDLPLAVK
jgi:hypothetical protein